MTTTSAPRALALSQSGGWASEEDREAFVRDLMAYGSAYSITGDDGLCRHLDYMDFARPEPEPGPNEIRNPWLP